jgi:hypothetical protein
VELAELAGPSPGGSGLTGSMSKRDREESVDEGLGSSYASAAVARSAAVYSDKRARDGAFDGERRAVELLVLGECGSVGEVVGALSLRARGAGGSSEGLELSSVEALSAQLGRLQTLLREQRLQGGDDGLRAAREVAAPVCAALLAMGETLSALGAQTHEPAAPAFGAAEAELRAQPAPVPARAVALRSALCGTLIATLRALCASKDAVNERILRCQARVAAACATAERQLVERRSDALAREQAHEQARTALHATDNAVAELISAAGRARDKAITNSNVVSLTLDAVLAPDPAMAARLGARRAQAEALAAAGTQARAARTASAAAEQAQATLRWSAAQLAAQAKGALARASAHRGCVLRLCAQALLREVPELTRALEAFLRHHAERVAKADKSVADKHQELREIERLYENDEALGERREIERRILEFQAVKARSDDAVRAVAEAQRLLWLQALVRPDEVVSQILGDDDEDVVVDGRDGRVSNNISSDNSDINDTRTAGSEPCVLPVEVVVRLQRCLDHLIFESGLAAEPGSALRRGLAAILRASSSFAPARRLEELDAEEKAAREQAELAAKAQQEAAAAVVETKEQEPQQDIDEETCSRETSRGVAPGKQIPRDSPQEDDGSDRELLEDRVVRVPLAPKEIVNVASPQAVQATSAAMLARAMGSGSTPLRRPLPPLPPRRSSFVPPPQRSPERSDSGGCNVM